MGLTSLRQLYWSIACHQHHCWPSQSSGPWLAQVVRKREKKQEEIKVEKKVVSEAGSEAPPETLADKVAQDDWIPVTIWRWEGNSTTLKWVELEVHETIWNYWAFMWHCSLKIERERERERVRERESVSVRRFSHSLCSPVAASRQLANGQQLIIFAIASFCCL